MERSREVIEIQLILYQEVTTQLMKMSAELWSDLALTRVYK